MCCFFSSGHGRGEVTGFFVWSAELDRSRRERTWLVQVSCAGTGKATSVAMQKQGPTGLCLHREGTSLLWGTHACMEKAKQLGCYIGPVCQSLKWFLLGLIANR